MMTSIVFEQWCEQLGLPPATRKLLADIRCSPPVRRVTSRAKNVNGTYPSSKMNRTIQFESQVEQRAILVMEYDPEVLEFYDQPTTFQIHYQSGKKRVGPYYTPNFLVLRRTSATFEEWKTASDLQQLAERVPTRYQQATNSLWHCPPAEAYTDPLGLSFRVRSSAELHPTYIDNLAFLEDYDGISLSVPESVQTHILQRLREIPGLPLSALSYDGSGIRPHDIYAMLAQKLIYTDLYAALLSKHGCVRLYLSEDQARAYTHLHPTALVSRIGSPLPDLASDLPTNTLLLWDGRSFTLVNPGETTTTLLSEKGPPLQIPSPFFFHLLEQGEIKRLGSKSQAPTTVPEVDQLLDRATLADQRQATEHFVMVSAYLQGDKDTCAAIAPRTLHRWVAHYREAETRWSCGYVGLLTRRAHQGNHTPKAPEASHNLMETFIIERFETPRHELATAVYRAYEQECRKQDLHPISATALDERKDTLSLDQLQEHALEVEQCQQMMLDAFEGEQKLNYTEAHREHLWRLLQGGELIAPVPPLPPRGVLPSELKPATETQNAPQPVEQAVLLAISPEEEASATSVKKTRARKKPKENPPDETIQESTIQAEASAIDPPKRRRKKTTKTVAENGETEVKVPSSANGEVSDATVVSPTQPKRTRHVGEPKPKRYPVEEREIK